MCSMTARSSRFANVVRGAVVRRGAALMGICNVTPDSFSDGGLFHDPKAAFARVEQLLADGADILDIGGESTRPGSQPVPADVQKARVLPVMRHAAALGACISIDTTSPDVAAACLDVGAHAVNDVSLLRDEDLARVVAGNGAMLVLSHARFPQSEMRSLDRPSETRTHDRPSETTSLDRLPELRSHDRGPGGGAPLSPSQRLGDEEDYGDIVVDVLADWERAAARARVLGVPRSALIMDPGLGFSKTSRHSFELVRQARRLVAGVDVPVLFGASRKSFLTLIEPASSKSAPGGRDGASLAVALHAIRHGVQIVRIHDVRATRQAIDMANALGSSRRKI